MGDADESPIYRDLMRLKPRNLTPNAWAVKAGVSRAVWADMKRHGNPSRRTLEKLLVAVDSSLAEFEALRIGAEPRAGSGDRGRLHEPTSRGWTPAQLPPLPVIGTSLIGEWGEPGSAIDLIELRSGELVDRLPRPASLADDPGAYALTIVGNSMWPRFRPGRRVAVSPRAAVAIGDDVVLRFRSAEAAAKPGAAPAIVAELARRTSKSLELRQFSPEQGFDVDADLVDAVHKIVGELF